MKKKVDNQKLLKSLQYVLKKALKTKKTGKLEIYTIYCGICHNVEEKYNRRGDYYCVYDDLMLLFKGWKHHSGCLEYPVDDDDMNGIDGYRWVGKNLDKRIDLMQYTIKKLENRIKRAEQKKLNKT